MTVRLNRQRPVKDVVNSLYSEGVGGSHAWNPGSTGSGAWPAANRGLFVPVVFSAPVTIKGFWYVPGTTVGTTQTFDIGLFDAACSTMLGSLGGADTCSGGTTAFPRLVTITAFTVPAGMYHLAMSMSSTTPTCRRLTSGGAGRAKMWRWMQAASAHPLASSPSLAAVASDYFPQFGLTQRTDLPA